MTNIMEMTNIKKQNTNKFQFINFQIPNHYSHAASNLKF